MVQIGASSATIESPLEHLSACHRRIEQRLDTLIRAADHLHSDPSAALAAIANCIAFLDSSGVLHTRDEEESVFPRLRPKLAADRIAYLDSLELDHQAVQAVHSRLKELVGRVEGDVSGSQIAEYRACAQELARMYRRQIRSEDDILTAMAQQLLNPEELAEITREMRERRL